jgi:hypothetical protein
VGGDARLRSEVSMSGLNQRIRDYLASQSEPVRPQQVANALEANAQHVRNALSSMRKAGLVLYDNYKGYMAGGRQPMSRKEAAALGGEARKAMVVPKKPKPIVMVPRRLGVTEVAAVRESFPSTDDWIAANPEKVERLPAGRWSQPLRFEY